MKRIVFIISIVVLGGLLNACSDQSNHTSVQSPDNLVQLSINNIGGTIKYELRWQNELIIDSSTISISQDVPVKILNTKIQIIDSTWNPVWGQFSEIRDNYNEIVMTLDVNGKSGKLLARVYNNGIGFRFLLNDVKAEDALNFFCEYNLADGDKVYYPSGENEPKGPIAISDLINLNSNAKKIAIPVVVERTNKKHLSILESDLYSARGFATMRMQVNAETGQLSSTSKLKDQKGKVVTPWKVILLGETAGDMLTNSVTINLAAPCELKNTDWIKPGKTLWDWRVHGYTAPDGFVYGINTESYKRFIDFADEKGIEYFLIDDSWYKHASKGHFELSDELDLQTVIDYAADKNVELILYYDRKHGEYGDAELFSYYQSLGMKGIKYGFMGNNTDFSRDAIRLSAQNELLIDFHDGPVPYTGVRRTSPNAITREYCHAQQDSRRAFTPEAFIKMAHINALQGPLDMNNGNFDLNGINSGKRQKGPKKLNSYLSTVVSEMARTLVIFSGLVCIPDAPEAYEAKADLFDFIQKMPVGKWDETQVLNSNINKFITTARRHGKEWFIGSVIVQHGGTLDIKLDFLEGGQTYEATFYEDTEDTNCRTNPEAYQIRKAKVKKGDLIQAKLAPGGGHCMWIRPEIIN
ncbi:glycoside hydrolase family 97 protein [Labilibaculum antarcticum]|uniref:Alpha-glucosidase n=1 Tax=Labilibaculum antarcticum TaxID=1717717 RepID=A0A1Y1CFD4_9BACT|nr:glycoside hydrolase family 97 protein [Labilibaculum antarcticum]BAX78813.1 alpha-glucosidase [Labilibaculum antarcticum]